MTPALDRPRLFRRLDARTPLTVVWGPAGYGKTALVESWLAHHPEIEVSRVAAPAGGVAGAEYWSEVTLAATALGDGSVLVLDLSKGIDPSEAWTHLEELCGDRRGIHIVVTLRDGGFFSGRWVSTRDVGIVTPAELEFTEEEVARLLADRGCVVSSRTVRDICRITGGHPTLVEMAEIVVRVFGRELEVERARAYSALEAQADEFVRRRLWPSDTRDGLCETTCALARVRRVTAGAASALGVEDPETVIATLERAGLLQRMPGASDRYWVFPGAVRRSLVRFSQRAGTAPSGEALAALARWCADNGEPVEALRHATDSQDWGLVIELLAAHWLEVATTRLGVVIRAVTALPEAVVRSYPALHFARELTRRLAPGSHDVPRPVARAFPPLESIAEDHSIELALLTGALRSTLMRWIGDYDEAVRELGLLVELADGLPTGPAAHRRGLSVMWLHLGLARQYRGEHAEAAALFARAVDAGAVGPDDYAARQSAGQLALQYAVLGESERGEHWIARESAFGDQAGWLGTAIGLPATTALALIQLDRLDLDAAESTMAAVPGLRPDIENWAFVLYVRCQLDLVRGQPEVGLDRLSRERVAFRKWLTPGSLAGPLLRSASMDLQTAAGAAGVVLDDVSAHRGGLHPLVALSAARAAALAGNAAAALKFARRLTDRENIYTRVRLEALLVTAMALLDTGDAKGADVAWARAVALSDTTGVLRPFATLPASTLDELSAAGPPAPAAWRALAWRGNPFPAPLHTVRLTERETAVLGGLARGESLARIAAGQFVSQNTVKSQVGSLYRKLGVHSRREAVEAARRRGML